MPVMGQPPELLCVKKSKARVPKGKNVKILTDSSTKI